MLQNRVNSEVASADPEQGGMLAFSRHIAAELSKPTVIASYPELGNKLTTYIESRTAVGSGPLGGPMLNIIGRHFDYDREAGAGLRQMLYLSHAPEGTSFKQLQAHMEHIVYLLSLKLQRKIARRKTRSTSGSIWPSSQGSVPQ